MDTHHQSVMKLGCKRRVCKTWICDYVSWLSGVHNYISMARPLEFWTRAIVSICNEMKVTLRMTKLITTNIMSIV